MDDWYEQGMALEDFLESGLDMFRSGRETYWRDNELLGLMENLGSVAVDASDDLTAPRGEGTAERLLLDRSRLENLRRLLEEAGIQDLLLEHMEIQMARRFSLTDRPEELVQGRAVGVEIHTCCPL